MKKITHTFCTNDREVLLETGRVARQADGSVILRVGNMVLLATVVSKKSPEEDVDFFPLSVEYSERFYAAGKIPGGFVKREGKPLDREILISRLIDRAIRPMFPRWYKNATQVNVTMISYDSEVEPEDYAALAASAALHISSNIPFECPISEVRVIKKEGSLIGNPNNIKEKFDFEITVAGTQSSILMVEGEASEISEKEFLEAIELAHEIIKKQCEEQFIFAEKAGLSKKDLLQKMQKDFFEKNLSASLISEEYKISLSREIESLCEKYSLSKLEREREFEDLFVKSTLEVFAAENYSEIKKEDIKKWNNEFQEVKKDIIRKNILKNSRRLDGRLLDEVREISIDLGFSPSAHGSCLFTRGETQSLSAVTLGTKMDEQNLDGVTYSGSSRFMLHYNFPGFSTGEVKASRGVSRREVGHGNLAMRALRRVLPPEKDHGYTIRIVSDILESFGSSSMATVCAGSLSLMDSGVQISGNVSGIAMGLILEGDNLAILSDISGSEDAFGDMDFKVAGTKNGITACQMDMKIQGISFDVLKKALEQAKKGREFILEKMNSKINIPRIDTKDHAPSYMSISVAKKYIGSIIGPSGRVIQDIQKKTGTTIFIEEKDDFGVVSLYSTCKKGIEDAKKVIEGIVAEPELNAVYKGRIKSILDFGAFVEFLPGKDGLLHISEVQHGERIENLNEVLSINSEIEVKLIEIDKKGKYKLSRKALLNN